MFFSFHVMNNSSSFASFDWNSRVMKRKEIENLDWEIMQPHQNWKPWGALMKIREARMNTKLLFVSQYVFSLFWVILLLYPTYKSYSEFASGSLLFLPCLSPCVNSFSSMYIYKETTAMLLNLKLRSLVQTSPLSSILNNYTTNPITFLLGRLMLLNNVQNETLVQPPKSYPFQIFPILVTRNPFNH